MGSVVGKPVQSWLVYYSLLMIWFMHLFSAITVILFKADRMTEKDNAEELM